MLKHPVMRWLLPALRYGLLLFAVWYLVTHVPWRDRLRLNDANRTSVRLIEQRPDGFVIEQDGQTRVIQPDEVHRVADGLLDIELGIASVAQRTDTWLALLAVLISAPVGLLQSLRLVWMLRIQEVRLSFWNAVKLSYAGNFFNFALPGTTGGDLIKAYYITRFTHRKTEAVTTVFLDRVVGLLGLVVLAGCMMLMAWDARRFGAVALVLLLVFGGLAVFCLFIVSQRLRRAIRLRQLAERLPAGEHLIRIGHSMIAMRRHKGLALLSLLNTVVLQTMVVISVFVMARALGMVGDFRSYFIFVPIGFLIAAIPISPPQAFGVLEWAYIQFFTLDLPNDPSQAVALALGARLIQLIWALPGVLVPMFGAHLPSQRQLEALESASEDLPDEPELSDAPAMRPAAAPR